MGRLAYLQANPTEARPGELDRLTDAYLTGGKTARGSSFLTLRQERSRRERETNLGEHVSRATRVAGTWLSQLPPLKRNRRRSSDY